MQNLTVDQIVALHAITQLQHTASTLCALADADPQANIAIDQILATCILLATTYNVPTNLNGKLPPIPKTYGQA